MRRPATAGERCLATPSVLACARCAAPNASFTYRSPSSASARESRSSLVSSPPRKRVFSRRSTSPSFRSIVAFSASSLSVLSTNETFRLGSSSVSRLATGWSEYFDSGLPLGRPRCESRTTRAPRSSRSSSVGIAARMRVSSVTCLSASRGTLKSTRTSARLPRSCSGARSRTVSLFMALELLADVLQQVDAARRVAPLVVVPAGDLEQRAVDHVRALRVEDARVRVADVVGRDELLLGVLEDAFELTGGGLLERRVDLVDVHGLVDDDGEVGERHVRRRDADCDAVDLPLQLGDHERGCLRGARRGRDDRHGSRTRAADVLVRQVENVLVFCVSWDGDHR